MILIILIIAMVAIPVSMVLVTSYKDEAYAQAASRVIELSPVAHNGETEYVYTRSYMEKVAKDVEHDINGFFS